MTRRRRETRHAVGADFSVHRRAVVVEVLRGEIVAVVSGALIHVLQEGGRPQYGAVAAAGAPVLRVTATELQRRLGRQRDPLSVQPVEPERAAERTRRPQELVVAWHESVLLLHRLEAKQGSLGVGGHYEVGAFEARASRLR